MKILITELEPTVDNLCKLIVTEVDKNPDNQDSKMTVTSLATLYFISEEFPGVRFNGRLIDNRMIHTLLDIAPNLTEAPSKFFTVLLLKGVIYCDFASSSYHERGVYVKGVIFSKTDLLIDITKKIKGLIWTQRYSKELFDIFITYVTTEQERYYKSTVRCLVRDGTIKRMAELFKDVCQDPEIAKQYINNVIPAYHRIRNCVDKFEINQVELRLLHPLAIEHLSTVICKDFSSDSNALKNTIMFIIMAIACNHRDEIIQLYFKNKVFKQLASAFVSTLRTSKDYELLTIMLQGLSSLTSAPQFKKYTKLNDIRVLIPYLPELVDTKKHSAAPPKFVKSSLTLASQIIIRSELLEEKHFAQLKDLNIISVFVENLRRFDGGKHPENELVSLSIMLYCVAHENFTWRLSLREIDQVLPAVPFLIKFLTGKAGHLTVYYGMDTRPHAAHPICLAIVQNLLRIKEDKTSCIKKQLNTLQQYNFLSGICEAAIFTEDLSVVPGLMDILDESNRLFDGREYIGSLVSFLPRLVEKQHRYNTSINPSQEKDSFTGDCGFIVIKAAAYVLDQLEPIFVEKEVAIQVLSCWLFFRISGGKMFFSSDIFKTEDAFGEKNGREQFFIDVLHGTWKLNRLYPNIVKSKIPRYWKSIPGSGDINKLTSSRIVGTIISYLDHSQEKSLVFLTELTTFVKDLADDTYIFDEEKLLFQDLAHACERFMMVNSNRVCIENLQYFINNFEKSVNVDGILLD